MKEAGLTTVRLGHLCWDSYEPEEGVYLVNREYLNETDKPMCFLEFQTGRPVRFPYGGGFQCNSKEKSICLTQSRCFLVTRTGIEPMLQP